MNCASQSRISRPHGTRALRVVIVIFATCVAMFGQSGASTEFLPSLASENVTRRDSQVCDLLEGPDIQRALSKTLHARRAEWALGKKLASDVEQHVELITGEFVLDYVNRLERNIARSAGLSGCFVVKVVHDPEPNAYSLPGGFIYVTTGLLDLVETEGQLVGALAHETAHVTGRHLTQLDRQARVWGSVALVVGPAGYGLRRLLGPLLLMKLLRNKELEADRLGIQYHIASGYEPMEFCTFLQIAFPDDDEKQQKLAFFRHLSDTHPSTRERIQHLHAAISTYQLSPANDLGGTREFAEMKMRFAIMIAAKPNP